MINRIKEYLKFYKKADTIYNIHSPVVFEFMLDVFDTKKEYYIFKQIEADRNSLLLNHTELDITDYGAGSATNKKPKNRAYKRTVSNIAQNVVSNELKCRLLFNLVNKYQPKTIIELGTSLGISTLYLSYASINAKIYTIEGDKSIFTVANNLFQKHHLKNIQNFHSTFDDCLPKILEQIQFIDLVYIDGNHSYDATIKYFQQLKQKCNTNSILVFDDIYWSEGMKKAWEEIKQDNDVKFTIDTFHLGFVYFDEIMPKQHFKVIEYWKKPFRIGLWG